MAKGLITLSGSTKNTQDFLSKMSRGVQYSNIESLAQKGVSALAAATPVDSGLTSASWGYEITKSNKGVKIEWINTNSEGGVNVAVILQYGHGTGTGGYVQGRDYINGAIRPIMEQIAEAVWREVINT